MTRGFDNFGGSPGSLSQVGGKDQASILADFISALDNPDLSKELASLGINIGGGDKSSFLNILPAILGGAFGLFNQPKLELPSFDPIKAGIRAEKAGALAGVDRQVGEDIGSATQELENQGFGALVTQDFASRARGKAQRTKGDIASKFTGIERQAKFDFDRMITELVNQFNFQKAAGQSQGIADIGQLLSLFLI